MAFLREATAAVDGEVDVTVPHDAATAGRLLLIWRHGVVAILPRSSLETLTMPNMRELVADLEARRAKVREMGGADKIAKQHARGKMTARERLAAFFDDGVFFEIGMHGTQMGLAAGPDGSDKPPADGVVTGFGKVDGRMVCAAAYDFTVKGGLIGYTGEEKVTRLRSMALKGRWPMVWFIDSGARASTRVRATPT